MDAPKVRATKAASVAPSAAVSAITSNPVKTRDDALNLFSSLLTPLVESQSEGGARVRLQAGGATFDSIAADFEGYARTLWGLAPALASEPDHPVLRPVGDLWARGLDAGTNPDHPEFWGWSVHYDQRFVEMAGLGVAIGLVPQVFWDSQTEGAKLRIAKWLLTINEVDIPENNWRYFRVLVNVGLKRVGASYSQDIIDETLQFIDTFYNTEDIPADGADGEVQAYDYYATSFAIPFYELLYSRLNPSDTARAEQALVRAKANANRVVHFFSQDGSAIPFGRSMTYRFACVAFFSAMAYAFDDPPAPFTWGVLKGLVLRHIRWFTQQESIFNRDGSLTIGWAYPQMFMSEQYNSPMSPYWAFKSPLVLALPKDHPFWTAEEEALPAEFASAAVVKSWNQVFSHEAGHDFLLTQGQRTNWPMRQTAAKYGKMAYSAQFGFSVVTGQWGLSTAGADSTLALSDDEGDTWKVPRIVEDVTVSDAGIITSLWKPWSDVTIRTWLYPPPPGKPWHTRVNRITSARALRYSSAGFSISSQSGPEGNARHIPVLKSSDEVAQTHGRWSKDSAALACSGSGVTGVFGMLGSGTGEVVISDPSANLMFSRSLFPTLTGEVEVGADTWVAVRVFASPTMSGEEWLREWQELEAWKDVNEMKAQMGIQ